MFSNFYNGHQSCFSSTKNREAHEQDKDERKILRKSNTSVNLKEVDVNSSIALYTASIGRDGCFEMSILLSLDRLLFQ